MKEAHWAEARPDNKIACRMCPHACIIPEEGHGLCRVRVNRGGQLYTLNFGQVSAMALDPIEKKPLYHFHPGSMVLSVGSIGCNLACDFCQNWRIAQADVEGCLSGLNSQPVISPISPKKLVEAAVRSRAEDGIGLAYTYSEPAVWWEFMMDVAPEIRGIGMKNVMVTNGFLNPEAWEELIPYLDAVNLDVKGFQESFYSKHCRGRLDPVLRSAELLAGRVHLELTTLIIPGENDSDEELKALIDWVAGLDRRIPLHFSRYFPQYKMSLPPTPEETLERACEIAREKLDYVYVGNSPLSRHMDTVCPKCGELWILRRGFSGKVVGLTDGKCRSCGMESPVVE